MDVNLQDSKILTQNKNFIIRNFEKNDIDSEFISWFKNKKNFKFSRHQNKNYTEKELINYHQKHKKIQIQCILFARVRPMDKK